MRTVFSIICVLAVVVTARAQFAPQAGIAGTTAVSAGGHFIAWANKCTVQRGYMDIAQPGLGKVSTGDSSLATGPADNTIVSLGDSGVATLTFAQPIQNGAGPDFAVFENGFINPANPEEAFLELAFVEVSSDGIHFTRFRASSQTPAATQIPGSGVYMNARYINNLAGKYAAGFGTPFDLDELAGTAGLDINNITHVRIVDVIGAIGSQGSKDQAGNAINDPYPTAFPTGGFDLDAVGVIDHAFSNVGAQHIAAIARIYPNPAADNIFIELADRNRDCEVTLLDITGKVLAKTATVNGAVHLPLMQYPAGLYLLQLADQQGNKWVEKISKI